MLHTERSKVVKGGSDGGLIVVALMHALDEFTTSTAFLEYVTSYSLFIAANVARLDISERPESNVTYEYPFC
jgi:hypothetical protein